MKWIASLLIVFASYSHAFGDWCETYAPMSTRLDGGKEIELVLPGSKVFAAPQWAPSMSGDPVLAISSLHALIADWASENLPRYDGVKINSITLKKYGCGNKDGKD